MKTVVGCLSYCLLTFYNCKGTCGFTGVSSAIRSAISSAIATCCIVSQISKQISNHIHQI